MYQDSKQTVGHMPLGRSRLLLATGTRLKGRLWLFKGRLLPLGAEERGQVEMQWEGNVACELDKIWPEALEVNCQGVWWRVDVQ